MKIFLHRKDENRQKLYRESSQSTDIAELVSDYGIVLKKKGVNFKGLCPFHSEKTPSFNVNSQRGFFHCFGCKASGDSIKFLMQIDRLSFTDAVQELAKRAGIPLERNTDLHAVKTLMKKRDCNACAKQHLFTGKKFLGKRERTHPNICSRERFRERCVKVSK
ncbi:MAG: hypothetical protein Ct9H300mP28_21870 [Pseudomonadota bacterium]|nr:MAG: hypothetical protein Ct9H300mP28_21870 [Pseudomonadota bacterium]